jgi:anthranilate phosphoribosyltransferase
VVTGIAEDFRSATDLARQAITTGKACEKLESLRKFSHREA